MLKSKKQWTWVPGEHEKGLDEDLTQISGAAINDDNNKSIFTIDCGDHFGLSDERAEEITNAVNVCAGVESPTTDIQELITASQKLMGAIKDYRQGMNLEFDLDIAEKDLVFALSKFKRGYWKI